MDRRALLRAGLAAAAGLVAGCSDASTPRALPPAVPSPAPSPSPSPSPSPTAASAREVLSRAVLPVLCYHQLRDHTASDGAYSRRFLVCPPAAFRAQLDALADDGWTTVGPDAYLAHLTGGTPLPEKAVLLSFDDSQGTQATEGLPQLVRRGMTGTFFCMTVVLDKHRWMSRDDLRRLRDAGMTVAAHTYDHHRADRYAGTDFALQFEQPRALLEKVLGQPVEHFAYPYGAWAPFNVPHLQAAGYRSAYQLSDKPVSAAAPAFTLRRTLARSDWSGPELLAAVRQAAQPQTVAAAAG